MLFNSLTFIVFFILVCLGYFLIRPWQARKGFLLVASYLFYAAWNPPFVLLLWFSTLVDWKVGNWLARIEDGKSRKLLLVLSLIVNLGLLGFFKYGQFLLDNFIRLAAMVGIQFTPPDMSIVLPVGISFYTFQTLSYTLDIYRRTLKPANSFLDFAFYVTFFPQLVAGPIVRASDFLDQCLTPKYFNMKAFSWGLFLMTLGLFQKIVLADTCLAPVAEAVFAPGIGALHPLDAWLGVMAFSGQIYCDFAGYSTCAIGAALALGFGLVDNFRCPYAAVGFSDFWKRWHISLSTWLRDYLYISLGGNRRGTFRTCINLMITMLLGGLWHGASWTFVVWGGLHGIFLILERGITRLCGHMKVFSSLPARFVFAVATYVMICITWVFFRSNDFPSAASLLASLFATHGAGAQILATLDMYKAGFVMAGLLIIHGLCRNSSTDQIADRLPTLVRSLIWTVMLVLIILAQGTGSAFIYFQF